MRYADVSDGLHSPEEFSAFVDSQREGLQTAFYDKNVPFPKDLQIHDIILRKISSTGLKKHI